VKREHDKEEEASRKQLEKAKREEQKLQKQLEQERRREDRATAKLERARRLEEARQAKADAQLEKQAEKQAEKQLLSESKLARTHRRTSPTKSVRFEPYARPVSMARRAEVPSPRPSSSRSQRRLPQRYRD
jgi:hypothetical protein